MAVYRVIAEGIYEIPADRMGGVDRLEERCFFFSPSWTSVGAAAEIRRREAMDGTIPCDSIRVFRCPCDINPRGGLFSRAFNFFTARKRGRKTFSCDKSE